MRSVSPRPLRSVAIAFVLNGTKTFITNAPVADVFVVFASTDPNAGFAGLSAFLVERDTPGLSVGPPFHKMGLTTSPMSEVVLEDCEVPATALLGSVGAGMAVFNSSMEWERSCILASAIGTMTRQLERSIEHARTRRQFGKPIGKIQAVAHRIVEMKVRLETARLLLYRTAWLKSQGRPAKLESAMTKLYISESFLTLELGRASDPWRVRIHEGVRARARGARRRRRADLLGHVGDPAQHHRGLHGTVGELRHAIPLAPPAPTFRRAVAR